MKLVSHSDVYHVGEIAVQERTGDRAVAERRAGLIGNRLAGAAREFLGRQRVAAVGAAEPDGTLWASLWCGAPGFLGCDEQGERVTVEVRLDPDDAADPVRSNVPAGAPLGMLVIDFATRQRLRVNGTVGREDGCGLELGVREVFGNCIKYIQRRECAENPSRSGDTRVQSGGALDVERLRFIAQADTLFVASIQVERGIDVSHRGGEPGFVCVKDERTLRIPDYAGNGMYQTLGNFELDSRAGVALIDFDRRRVLSMSGCAVGEFSAADPRDSSGGTGRYWSFTVERWMEFPLSSMMTWTLIERSPFNPRCGEP